MAKLLVDAAAAKNARTLLDGDCLDDLDLDALHQALTPTTQGGDAVEVPDWNAEWTGGDPIGASLVAERDALRVKLDTLRREYESCMERDANAGHVMKQMQDHVLEVSRERDALRARVQELEGMDEYRKKVLRHREDAAKRIGELTGIQDDETEVEAVERVVAANAKLEKLRRLWKDPRAVEAAYQRCAVLEFDREDAESALRAAVEVALGSKP